MPARPRIAPPVGKSGPGMISINSSRVISGLSIRASSAVDHLAEIMRRDVGRHADRDAARAIDQKIGEARRQDDGLVFLVVVVGLEIDRVACRGPRAAPSRSARAAIRCSACAAGGSPSTEPKLPCPSISGTRIEKVLRHAHQRVVDRQLAVRMIFTHHIADGARRFVVGPVGREIVFVHRIEDAPMHRLQPVAHVGQGAAHDHAHRVIEIAALHFVADRDGLDVGRPGGPVVAGFPRSKTSECRGMGKPSPVNASKSRR